MPRGGSELVQQFQYDMHKASTSEEGDTAQASGIPHACAESGYDIMGMGNEQGKARLHIPGNTSAKTELTSQVSPGTILKYPMLGKSELHWW